MATVDTPGRAVGVAVAEALLCVADETAGLAVVDIVDPTRPVLIGRTDTSGIACDVSASGDLAFLADGEPGLRVISLADPEVPAILGTIDTPDAALGVALTGPAACFPVACVADNTRGVQVLDIRNVTVPKLIGEGDTPGSLRDIVPVGNGLAFAADGPLGFEVIDILSPAAVSVISVLSLPSSAHAVAPAAAPPGVVPTHAFAAFDFGLAVIDVTDPKVPRLVGQLDLAHGARDIVVRGAYAFLAAAELGLVVVDVADVTAPALVGAADTPGEGLGVAITEDGAVTLVADGHAGLVVVDISEPSAPEIAGRVQSIGQARAVVTGGAAARAYVACGPGGLVLIDIANPTVPVVLASVPLPDDGWGVALHEGIAYVAVSGMGLAVVDVWNAAAPRLVGGVDTPGEAHGVAPSEVGVLVPDGSAGLAVASFQCPRQASLEPAVSSRQDAPRLEISSRPNPVWRGGQVRIEYTLSERVIAAPTVALRIVDASGRTMRVLRVPARLGPNVALWDGRDESGRGVPAGVYWLQLAGRATAASTKLTVAP